MILKHIYKSFRYYLKSQHIPVLLGTILCTAILTGALIVGDSVKYSLHKITLDRLGNITHAIESGDRYFRAKLATDLQKDLKIPVASALHLQGIVLTQGGQDRVSNAQVLGIDPGFSQLFPGQRNNFEFTGPMAQINKKLATKLNLKIGDDITIRINAIDFFPIDAPFARKDQDQVTLQVRINDIIQDDQYGRFSLKTNQTAPYNIFLPLEFLSAKTGIPERANTLLFANKSQNPLPLNELHRSLKFYYKLTDAGYRFVKYPDLGEIELRTDRIFIDPVVENAIHDAQLSCQEYLSYFVNEFRCGKKSTPYSFISTLPGIMNKDIVINEWLARDLNAKRGDTLNLQYYILGADRRLETATSGFAISGIRSMSESRQYRSLMPDYPGIAGTENCRDWDPGIPIDLKKIRDKDEQYWDDYGGTPKAWISLIRAQELWGNNFGHLTTIRFALNIYNKELIENKILDQITPEDLNMVIQPVREEGLEASSHGVDFGQLFIGLSFFVIAAALILTGLLFIFALEKRSTETALYMTMGYRPVIIKLIYLGEFLMVAIPGILIGIFGGVGYNRLIMAALNSYWLDIVGTSDLVAMIKPATLFVGGFASFILIFISIIIVLKYKSLQSIVTLKQHPAYHTFQKVRIKLWCTVITLLSAGILYLLLTTDPGRGKQAYMPFFGGGTLLLALGMVLFYIIFYHYIKNKKGPLSNLLQFTLINVTRNIRQSLTVVMILAIGVFLVIAVGANRHGTLSNADKPSSGTGGFRYWMQTTMPVLKDINSPQGMDLLGLDPRAADSMQILSMRLLNKDDASCLNLNRVQQPAILGLDPAVLDSLHAFTFIKLDNNVDRTHPWKALDIQYDGEIIPAIMDETVLVWGIAKAVGDTIFYQNERGERLGLKVVASLANSVFQGHVIIAQNNFTDQFPSVGGHSVFLINSPASMDKEIETHIPRFLQDYGVELMPTFERLALFNQIENTYLSIFLVLGGLALLLSSAGLGIIALRNILERQHEFALLQALGYPRKYILRLVVLEHFILLLIGTVIGALSAIFAMLPVLSTPGSQVPYFTMFLIILGLLLSGWLWIYILTRFLLKKDLITSLRTE